MSICLFLLTFTSPVRADNTPPAQPPGGNIKPGVETTQVQMVVEKVVIDFTSPEAGNDNARVTAIYTMHNPSTNNELIQVRFPLNGDATVDAATQQPVYPLIDDLTVVIGGQVAVTQVITTTGDEYMLGRNGLIYWAAFDVLFPARQDVNIQVNYTLHPTDYGSQVKIFYFLETGAGWNGPIGIADIFLRLSYDVSCENLICGEHGLTPNFAANVAYWHWENLEPTSSDNLTTYIVRPSIWQRILEYQNRITEDSYNVISWRELASGLKQSILDYEGNVRSDPAAQALIDFCIQAYERVILLKPEDAASHAEFAEFLWLTVVNSTERDDTILQRITKEINLALSIDPQNALALEVKSSLEGNGSATPQASPSPTPVLPKASSTATATVLSVSPSPATPLMPAATVTYTPTPRLSFTSTATSTLQPSPKAVELTRTPVPTPLSTSIQKQPSSGKMWIDPSFIVFAVGIALGLGMLALVVWMEYKNQK